MFNSDHSEERANYEKCCSLASSHNLIMGRDGGGVSDLTVLLSVQRSNTKQKLNKLFRDLFCIVKQHYVTDTHNFLRQVNEFDIKLNNFLRKQYIRRTLICWKKGGVQ